MEPRETNTIITTCGSVHNQLNLPKKRKRSTGDNLMIDPRVLVHEAVTGVDIPEPVEAVTALMESLWRIGRSTLVPTSRLRDRLFMVRMLPKLDDMPYQDTELGESDHPRRIINMPCHGHHVLSNQDVQVVGDREVPINDEVDMGIMSTLLLDDSVDLR